MARTWPRLHLVCVILLVSRLKVSCHSKFKTQYERHFSLISFLWLFFLSLKPKQIGLATPLTFSVRSIYGYTDTAKKIRLALIRTSVYIAPATKITCLFSRLSWLHSVQDAYRACVCNIFQFIASLSKGPMHWSIRTTQMHLPSFSSPINQPSAATKVRIFTFLTPSPALRLRKTYTLVVPWCPA